MSSAGLAAALLSSLCWSALDATRKALSTRLDVAVVVAWVALGQVPLFAALSLAQDRFIDDAAYLAPGLGSTALQLVANVLFVEAVRVSPLSVSVPFLSLTPVFTAAVAMPVLGEHPTPVQWAGIGTVVVGALLLNARQGHSLLRALLSERGSVLMIGVAALWSVTAALDKIALGHASVGAHGLVQTAGMGILVVTWMFATGRGARLRTAWPPDRAQVAAVGFAAGALALQLVAFQLLLVGLVETLKRGVGVIASVLLGRLAFEEPVTPPKVVAMLLMAAGSALVSIP
jgi:drug/metabolite transporter (DMT)-like permease